MATVTSPEAEDVDLSAAEPFDSYEVVNGLLVEEPPLGAREIWIASRLVRAMIAFDLPGTLGNVVEEALFVLERSPRLRRRPDVAFITNERWPVDLPAPSDSAWDVVPDLVVEIISPTDLCRDIMVKIEEYFRVGVRIVWVIYPEFRKIYAYESPIDVRILQVGDQLDGRNVLPGFRLPLIGLLDAKTSEPSPS